MINIKNVNYKYDGKSDKYNLLNLNLRVDKGECILICGRSGSGKSTITKLINSLIPNYYQNGKLEGEIKIEGIDTGSSQIYEVSRFVSSVFQNPKTQFFNINTTSELLFYLENRGFQREYMHEKLIETAKLFSIEDLLDRDIFKLSGGEKQIIAIAAAYASGTDIIVLDEPSSNLDESNTMKIGEILRKIKERGKTIVISEHRFYFIKDIIDKVFYIDDGKIKYEYSKEEFFNLEDDFRKKIGFKVYKI
ncbi:MAG: ABC transporter ATP-binding protein [Tissierellia bacterium]|nr:ABC transporter ATP-binding protein [Tissierellia bacterium]